MKRTRVKPASPKKQSNKALPLLTGTVQKQSIARAVRQIVARQPDLAIKQVRQELVKAGWEESEVQRRASTIATLRADAAVVLQIARESGWSMPTGKRGN